MQSLRDPKLQLTVTNVIVSIGIAIATFVAIGIFRKQSRKELAYEAISNTPVITYCQSLCYGSLRLTFPNKFALFHLAS
jgi:hypothetical protein